MTDPIRTLALSVSRCPQIRGARADAAHPCHQIVNLQPDDPDVFQVPEGWAGNLLDGRIVFVSSNPSISEVGDAASGGSAELYPTASWDDDRMADFIVERFHPERGSATAEGRFKRQDGTWSKKVRFWTAIRNRATELLGRPAHPEIDYVMTEVVHCKSKKQIGVPAAVSLCAEKHLNRVLAGSPAEIVVIGASARDYLVPLWGLPTGFGQASSVGHDESANLAQRTIGGQERTVTFLWHPAGGRGPKTFPGAYPTRLPELQRLASGELTSL